MENIEVKYSTQELHNQLWKKLQDLNILCDSKILNHKWHGHNVWLSLENQHNFKATFDLCREGLKTIPVQMKIGDEYYKFTSLSELTDFYLSTIEHVESCLEECRESKEAIENEYKVLMIEAKIIEENAISTE